MKSENNNSPPGTPNVQLQLESLFGKRVEVIKSDTNRLDPASEAADLMRRSLIQARFTDAMLNAVSWVAGSGFLTSLCFHTPFLSAFWLPFGLLCLVGIGAVAYGLFRVPDAQIPILLKVAFVVIGVIIGGRPL
ncbi:hypothetical protein NC981_19245 [Leptolyngbya sp. DQ-M1]|uniref:hypothetical protein n=1 Tax=Leptolyngbya sp. DQ-M1 TaxID=2933920 RepID=UPI003299FBC7